MRLGLIFGASVCALFVGCTTKIPTSDELALKAHIPKHFVNSPKDNNAQNLENLDSSQKKSKKKSKSKTPHKTPIERFYLFIDDKGLHTLLDIALERNTNVLTMASRIKQAKSQVRIDTASLFPTISGNVSANYTDRRTQSQSISVQTGTNSVSANLSASWELDLFGKLNALRKSSKKDYEQAQANLQDAQMSLLSEVGNLYFTLRDNAYNIKLGEEMLENLKEIDSISKKEYERGLVDLNTYRTNRQSLVTQQNSLETLRYTYEQNKNALLVLLDINADELDSKVKFLDSVKEDLPEIANYNINTIPVEVILERPDVKSSVFALHSQLYKVTNAKAARLPTISLSGSIGRVLLSTVSSASSLVYQIASSISTPLLNRVSLRETYKIQKELGKEAFYTLQETINTALSEIENALFNKDSQQRQVENNAELLRLSTESYQTDKVRMRSGIIDTSEFLSNANTHISIQTQYFTSRVNELIAAVTLFKAFGGALYLESEGIESVLDSTLDSNQDSDDSREDSIDLKSSPLDSANKEIK